MGVITTLVFVNPEDNDPPTTQPFAVRTTTIETTIGLNASAPEFYSTSSKLSLYIDTSQAVLLQTALAEIYNPTNPSLVQRVWIILDNGNQRSYLTQQIREKLALGSVSLLIATFSSTSKTMWCETEDQD